MIHGRHIYCIRAIWCVMCNNNCSPLYMFKLSPLRDFKRGKLSVFHDSNSLKFLYDI